MDHAKNMGLSIDCLHKLCCLDILCHVDILLFWLEYNINITKYTPYILQILAYLEHTMNKDPQSFLEDIYKLLCDC